MKTHNADGIPLTIIGVPTRYWELHISCDGSRVLSAGGFFTKESALRHALIHVSRMNMVKHFVIDVLLEETAKEATDEGAQETNQR